MQAKKGDRVRVHYVGTFPNNGEVFDSSVARNEPIEFEVGAGQMIKGFDDAVNGMAVGEKKTVNILAADAYGQRRDDQLIKVDRANLPEGMNPKVGDNLAVQDPQGRNIPVVVYALDETHITLDANHPMAGKDLTFEIELVEISA
ncbi:MAG: FKBP-type peptidyl-prolyl cis-trans isomerase [Flammeovirgaceae bacterium]